MINTKKLQEALRQARSNNFCDPLKEARLVEYALAKALGFTQPIPTQEPDNYKTYYLSTCASTVNAVLSEINDVYAFNVRRVQDATFQLCRMRCALVFVHDEVDDRGLHDVLFGLGNVQNLDPAHREFFQCQDPDHPGFQVTGLVDMFKETVRF